MPVLSLAPIAQNRSCLFLCKYPIINSHAWRVVNVGLLRAKRYGAGKQTMAAKPNHFRGNHNPIQPSLDDTFKLVAETRQQVSQVAESAREAIQTFYTEPHKLAEFIESHGTPVYILPGGPIAHIVLKALGLEPGFILPDQSSQFRGLQKFLEQFTPLDKTSKSEIPGFQHGVFVIPKRLFTVGFLSHQLHHWLAFRSGMAGYCPRARQLYKRFWNEQQGKIGREVYKMDVEDILALKAAIARDLEALQFLKNIANEVLIPARQAKRITHGTASA